MERQTEKFKQRPRKEECKGKKWRFSCGTNFHSAVEKILKSRIPNSSLAFLHLTLSSLNMLFIQFLSFHF